METLYVKNFGQIKNIKIKLADLTIFSGINASGKGILLQLIKLIIDRITATINPSGEVICSIKNSLTDFVMNTCKLGCSKKY